MLDGAAFADAVWRRAMMPVRPLTVSEWADAHRVLPPTVAEPGQWRTARTPYLREVMDALSESSAYEVVILMAGSQVGKTECGLNWCGYFIDHAPGLAMMVQPSLDMTKRNVRTRLDPMIEASPTLTKLVGPVKSKSAANNLFLKEFPGGQLVMTGANAGSSLRSTPARYLFLDEVDAYPSNVDDEGDPVDLAVRRTATFRSRRKVFMVSTPTVRGFSRIETAYLGSDRRRFYVPCPQCGHFAPITWARIRWPKGKRAEAHLVCEECGGVAEERDKGRLLAQGQWRATAEGDGITAGFWISALYSPFESWADIALAHGKVKSDPARLQVWTNTALAETWEDQASEALDADRLAQRHKEVSETIPAGGLVLTAGVDTQGDRLEAQLVAWGIGEEAFVVAYEIFPGDPSGPQVWARLEEWLERVWRHELGPEMTVRAVAVDTGGHHTTAAYDFCRDKHHRKIYAIKGASVPAAPAWPRRPAYTNKGKVPLYSVGVSAIKDTLAARLAKTEPGPATIHFTGALPAGYFDQLTSERRIATMVAGRPVRKWEKKPGVARNEAWDTLVYAYAALSGLKALGLDFDTEQADLQRAAAGADAPRARRKRSSWMNR